MTLLTKEQAKQTAFYMQYACGEWAYKDDDNYWHLFINDKEVTEGIKAISCAMFGVDYWTCTEKGGKVRLFKAYREYKEILTDKEITNVSIRYQKGLIYCDSKGDWHKVVEERAA